MMADEAVQAKLQQARKLIIAKRYDEARTLLRTIDHPKAKSWLAQLDKIAPEKAAPKPVPQTAELPLEPEYTRSAYMPSDPSKLIGWIFLVSIPVVGLFISWNWRRLGKPQWVWISLLLTVVLPILLIIGIIASVSSLTSSKLSNITTTGLIVGAFATNWVAIYAVYYLQRGAYNKWKTGRREDFLSYQYPLEKTAIVGLVIIALATVGGSVYTFLRERPKQLESGNVVLYYPPTWQIGSMDDYTVCAREGTQCIFSLWNPDHTFHVFMYEFPAHEGTTAVSHLEDIAATVPESYENYHIYPITSRTIAGYTAAKLRYDYSEVKNGSFRTAEEFSVIVANQMIIQFMVTASSPQYYQVYHQELDELFAGVRFKNLPPPA